MLLVSELITIIRRRLHQPDEAGSAWDDPTILSAICESAVELSYDVPYGRAMRFMTGTGVSKYPLPSDCFGVEDVKRGTIEYKAVGINDMNMVDENNCTSYYSPCFAIFGQHIYFAPALGSETVVLRYNRPAPAVENTEDYIDVPVSCQQPLVFRTIFNLLAAIGNPDAASYKAFYDEAAAKAYDVEAAKQSPKREMRFSK